MLLRAMVIACAAWLPLVAACQSLQPTSAPAVASRDSVRADLLNQQGLSLLEENRLADAENALRAAIEADSFFGPAFCNLGVCLLKQEKYYDAAWNLRHAAQLMPRASAPRMNLGLLYGAVGRYGPAEAELTEALARDPGDVVIVGQLARIHIQQDKRTSQTVAWLEQVAAEHDEPAWREWARFEITRTSSASGGVR